ncbi:alpha/beta fold hydrolase [Sporichthya polymorpha]|uniref:alpha/beta fold hydrolase n=1 Tax=Sporichthya polymorpha TaxID=35751 RepID=UPI000361711C|nr:alpha/beta fold hydrolase [Sporichthya polymorpha]
MDLSRLTGPVRQLGATVANASEVIRYGGLLTGELPSEFSVVARRSMFRLRRYFPDDVNSGAPVLLVPPLMMSADVYDVSPSTSAVRFLHESGLDPWVVDFGAPEREEGGLKRTVVDHVLAVHEAVDLVRAHTNRDVHLSGYSQGGMFAYQVAAYRRSSGIASLITFGAPVDSRATRVFGVVAEDVITEVAGLLADHVLVHVSLPAWASRFGFRLLDPVKSTRTRLHFLLQLHDREALLPREGQRQFLDNNGYVAYPGPAIAEFVKNFLAHNRMLQGGFVIGDVMSTLADITCPVLAFVGTLDSIAPPPSVRAIARAAPKADTFEVEVPTGHFGMVVGSGASRATWPRVADWVTWRELRGGRAEDRPDAIAVLDVDAEFEPRPNTAPLHAGVDVAGYAVTVAWSGLGAAAGGLRALISLAGDAQHVLPRLARLERLSADERVSVGALLEERTRNNAADHFFVFDGRGHTYADAGVRVDNVVRGLLSIGVRPGDSVGVLMSTRPSALVATAALNRIGAVAVMLRPDGATAVEARLGDVKRIIADPEHAEAARAARKVSVYVLGGGGAPRTLGPGITDLERITPALVQIPEWYVPNPGRASDLAFLLFTGEGTTTRCHRITNGQWARSAYGTASAAKLSPADTVYSVTPLHHAAGLLTSVGGALAGGSRLALATSYDPATFWSEVRRYGVTVVSYTWTLLRDLIEADRVPGERHHPVRLFVGSGMPTWLWQRTVDRFPTAGVLEFFASSGEDVVLANLSGRKVGAKGRPIPGSAEVAVVSCDLATGELRRDLDGVGARCAPEEPGLLVARCSPTTPDALRDVLAPGDAWRSTGHVFRRDADGDHWLIGALADLVHTAGGVVPPAPAEDALGTLDEVELVAAYGVRVDTESDTPPAEELHAALVLRRGRTLDAPAVTAALAGLSALHQPAVVRVLPTIPVTTWWRPLRAALRADAAAEALVTWVRQPDGSYAEPPKARRRRRGT